MYFADRFCLIAENVSPESTRTYGLPRKLFKTISATMKHQPSAVRLVSRRFAMEAAGPGPGRLAFAYLGT